MTDPVLLAAFDWDAIARVIFLRDYNTRVVLLGTTLLGIGAGVVGTLMCLRQRALVGDVASHAALPGIAAVFLLAESLHPGTGRWLPGLLLGAGFSAAAALLLMPLLTSVRRVKPDAALGVILSTFFGLGVVLFTLIQGMPSGQSAGLNEFIFGKAASLLASDLWTIAGAAALVLVVCGVLFKEFGLLCFDPGYAAAIGLPVLALDLLLTALVIAVTVIGLQSVGLLLVVALLVLPATSARFWTDRVGPMTIGAGVLGGVCTAAGVLLSAMVPRFAAGATIVLMGSLGFLVSLFLGHQRGILWNWLRDRETRRRVGLDDLLRACYEVLEPQMTSTAGDWSTLAIPSAALQDSRQWSTTRVTRLVSQAVQDGYLWRDASESLRLTNRGVRKALQTARNHRLWELYLIHYGDVAPALVDRQADAIEHVVQPEIVNQLERLLHQTDPRLLVPANPHATPNAG